MLKLNQDLLKALSDLKAITQQFNQIRKQITYTYGTDRN